MVEEGMMHSCQNPEDCSICAMKERDKIRKKISQMESEIDRIREFSRARSEELNNQNTFNQEVNRELKEELNRAIRIIRYLYDYSLNTDGWTWVKEKLEEECPKDWLGEVLDKGNTMPGPAPDTKLHVKEDDGTED
jgi:hypothetical protein